MKPLYFLNVLKHLFSAPGAFPGYPVEVFEGLRSNLSNKYTLQIFPTDLKEETRAENVIFCTDTWQICGAVNTTESAMLTGDAGGPGVLRFIEDTKKALDGWQEESGDFTSAQILDVAVNYEAYPTVIFNLQLEIKYVRRLKND